MDNLDEMKKFFLKDCKAARLTEEEIIAWPYTCELVMKTPTVTRVPDVFMVASAKLFKEEIISSLYKQYIKWFHSVRPVLP